MALTDRATLDQVAHEYRIDALGDADNDGTVDATEELAITSAISDAQAEVYGLLGNDFTVAAMDADTFLQRLTSIRALYHLELRRGGVDAHLMQIADWARHQIDDIKEGRRALWSPDDAAVVNPSEPFISVTTTDQQPVFHQTEYDINGDPMNEDIAGTLDNF